MSRRTLTLAAFLLAGGLLSAQSAKKILFDHTGYQETGSSADWLVCRGSEPNPTPANPTKETDWSGGISAWGFDLFRKGYTIQTLPATGRITYGDATNALDLANYAAFVIPERYKRFTAGEMQALASYVQNGGGLFLQGNHYGAKRAQAIDPATTDAPTVFNEFLASSAGTSFGFTFVEGHAGDTAANTVCSGFTTASGAIESAIVRGPNGSLTSMDFHSYGYLNLTGTNGGAKPILVTQVAGDPASDCYVVAATVGKGRVVAISDSSPADDGTTTASGKNLHNGWVLYSNRAFHLNAVEWLASGTTTPPYTDVTAPTISVTETGTAGTITFGATAADNVGVVKVEWYVDNALVGSRSASPWTLSYDSTKLSNATHALYGKAYDAAGCVGLSSTVNFTVSNPVATGTDKIVNGGFENGTTGWLGTTTDIGVFTGQSAYEGTRYAWICGTGATANETLYQDVAIPTTATSAVLSFYLHIDTAETGATVYDTLLVRALNTSGNVLKTLATYSNANAAGGYLLKTFDLTSLKGQTVRIHFKGTEDSSLQTSFVLDKVALIVK